MILGFGAIAVTLVVLLLAGLGTFLIINNGQAKVIAMPADLPKDMVICPHFTPGRMVVVDLGKQGLRYHVEGECPVAQLELQDSYISDLAYAGWTVHADPSGALAGYNYAKREYITVVLNQGTSSTNATAVALDMSTLQDVPDGFPRGPTPAPTSPSPR